MKKLHMNAPRLLLSKKRPQRVSDLWAKPKEQDFWDRSNRGAASSQAGFTIIELMIATLVFSTVLVVITAGVLYFSRSYYAGLNRSATQNTARAIIDSVTEAIQFTGTVISTSTETGSDYFCAGNKIYSFKPGAQYQGGTATITNPGLYVAPQSGGCTALSASDYDNANAQQLLAPKMRIAALSLTSLGGQMYRVSVTVAYGDDDLLVASGTTTAATTGSDLTCRSNEGSQFCAVVTLNATVQRRLQDGQLSS